jgi:hypothetical protein
VYTYNWVAKIDVVLDIFFELIHQDSAFEPPNLSSQEDYIALPSFEKTRTPELPSCGYSYWYPKWPRAALRFLHVSSFHKTFSSNVKRGRWGVMVRYSREEIPFKQAFLVESGFAIEWVSEKRGSIIAVFPVWEAARHPFLKKHIEWYQVREPLHRAVVLLQSDRVRELIEVGQGVDVKTDWPSEGRVHFRTSYGGMTALHYAVARRSGELVDILLAAGADPTIRAVQQYEQYESATPMDIAEWTNQADILRKLRDSAPEPPSRAQQIQQILELLRASVADGTLEGAVSLDSPDESAEYRLNVMADKLESTSLLIAKGDFVNAYMKLSTLVSKCNGSSPPADLVKGEAREELGNRIEQLWDDLGKAVTYGR